MPLCFLSQFIDFLLLLLSLDLSFFVGLLLVNNHAFLPTEHLGLRYTDGHRLRKFSLSLVSLSDDNMLMLSNYDMLMPLPPVYFVPHLGARAFGSTDQSCCSIHHSWLLINNPFWDSQTSSNISLRSTVNMTSCGAEALKYQRINAQSRSELPSW